MRPFNFAESKITEREYCRRYISGKLRGIAVFMVLALIVAAASSACRTSVRNKATSVKSKFADTEAKCVKIKQDMAGLDTQIKQREWQKSLSSESEKVLENVDGILSRVSEDIWLVRVESSQEDANIILEGRATSYESLSAFTRRLRRAPQFVDILLRSSRTASKLDSDWVDFAVEIKLDAPADAQQQNNQAAQGISSPGGVPELGGESH